MAAAFDHPRFGPIVRTPDDRFANLPGWTFAPKYIDDLKSREGLRLHYIDEGPRDADVTFLCLHGEPSWAYLYRKMLPVFVAAGHRVVAPDWFGFGRSDKPVKDAAYTFDFHRDTISAFLDRMALKNVCLVVQDWGGLLGLTLPVDVGFRARLGRLLVMNTTLATGEVPSPGFLAWRAYVAATPDLPVGALLKRATPILTAAEVAAYDAPFPDARHKAGVRAFPQLVMTEPGMPGIAESVAAKRFWSDTWGGPTFMAVGAADPVLGTDVMAALRQTIHGCPAPLIVPDGGHFLQEWGEPIARTALAAFARS